MAKIECIEDNCKENALYNYKDEKGYKYCKNHVKTRIINGKTQYMGNKSKKMCNIDLCSKNLAKESKNLCSLHYEIQFRNIDNLTEINNINDLNNLKSIYELRLNELNKLVNIEEIKKFTNNDVTKYKLQGLKHITYIEELNEFIENKKNELDYLNNIDIKNLEQLKKLWLEDYKNLTGNEKNIKPNEEKIILNNNPMCIIIGCETSATYNVKGAPAIYCSKHANDKQINKEGIGNLPNQLRNVRTKLCEYIDENNLDCIKIATCGLNKKQYCATHAEEGMYKLSKEKKCKKENCNITPSYGLENGIAEYCAQHKLESMIQLYQKCIYPDCSKRARYNKKGEKGCKYCLEHKDDDMLDIHKDICIELECNNVAEFNVKSIKKGIYCSLHKKENMCSNKNIICKETDCITIAYFGTKEEPRQYCSSHKKENMFNYTSGRCQSCDLYQVKRKPFLCSYCNPNANQKTKEMQVVDFLNKNNIQFIHNKSVGYLCGNFRPDILIDCNTHFIVVEIDEEQHKQYTKECEFARMNNIYLANGLPTVFIRFNPDIYTINKKKYKTQLLTRLNNLLKLIDEYSNKEINNYIELLYMYYDCECEKECNFIHKKIFIL